MRTRNSLIRLALTATVTGVLAVGAPAVALAAATGPAAVSAGSATSAETSVEPSQNQWKQLNKIADTHSALGVADSGTVLRLAAGTSAAEKTKVQSLLPSDTVTTVRTSQFSKGALDKIQKTVTSRAWSSDADKYGVATSYDAKTDKVTVLTDAPASVTKSLRSAYPGAVDVQQARLEPQTGRFADAQPFWGGAALIGTLGTQAFKCTAGFAVRQRATGHLYMTTAGHCFSNLTHVYSRRENDSFGNWVGQVTRRDRNIDTELLSGNTAHPYDGFMFTGGTASSRSSMFVHGTEAPEHGRRVCVSGSVSFNHCGHPISNTRYSICYSGGSDCIRDGKGFLYDRGGTNWPRYDNGKVTKGGDSGAPIYTTDDTESGAWIVGGHSGVTWLAGGPCHCSTEYMVGVNIEAIRQDLGVEVVTR
ncbi:hypothetical protein QQY66_20260 [Streptomyces sp. DG2A-72]|uniref:hypothetical protein n=1 Tax=Streptomyces sp. DG2A-72 TaxID=3051386 RepID=UPI00265B90CC|nr:hypothetical protein [Streptomyces sp. DG2A-72]MDO0933904.1 hypothetical protein [Streptomyces sp. DG2A-72]